MPGLDHAPLARVRVRELSKAPNDAAHAIDVLNFQVINGKPIRVLYSQRDPAVRRSGVGNIFIKNSGQGDRQQGVAGYVCAVRDDHERPRWRWTGKGTRRGTASCSSRPQEAAQAAIDNVNGMELNDKQVYVGPFQRRAERSNTGESQVQQRLREELERKP